MKISIAMWQSNIRFGEPAENLSQLSIQAQIASQSQADLLLLPELCLHGYHKSTIINSTEYHLPAILPHLSEIARKNHMAMAGTFVEDEGDHRFNTLLLLDSSGNLLAKYRKTHLFKKLNEDKFFIPGNSLTIVDTDWGRIGLAVCYDLRFPEIFRSMMRQGAEGFLVCSEWPTARINHWKTLLQSRAIENQAWVAACNCTGISGQVEFGGASSVITPWGDITTAGDQEELLFASIHTDQVQLIRSENPFLEDYREDL